MLVLLMEITNVNWKQIDKTTSRIPTKSIWSKAESVSREISIETSDRSAAGFRLTEDSLQKQNMPINFNHNHAKICRKKSCRMKKKINQCVCMHA